MEASVLILQQLSEDKIKIVNGKGRLTPESLISSSISSLSSSDSTNSSASASTITSSSSSPAAFFLAFASSRFRSCSSAFVLLSSSICANNRSLYGKLFGIFNFSFFFFRCNSGCFFASLRSLRCFSAPRFSILCLRRTGTRFDFFSGVGS